MSGSPAVNDVFWQKVDNQQYARLVIGGRVSGATLVSVSCDLWMVPPSLTKNEDHAIVSDNQGKGTFSSKPHLHEHVLLYPLI